MGFIGHKRPNTVDNACNNVTLSFPTYVNNVSMLPSTSNISVNGRRTIGSATTQRAQHRYELVHVRDAVKPVSVARPQTTRPAIIAPSKLRDVSSGLQFEEDKNSVYYSKNRPAYEGIPNKSEKVSTYTNFSPRDNQGREAIESNVDTNASYIHPHATPELSILLQHSVPKRSRAMLKTRQELQLSTTVLTNHQNHNSAIKTSSVNMNDVLLDHSGLLTSISPTLTSRQSHDHGSASSSSSSSRNLRTPRGILLERPQATYTNARIASLSKSRNDNQLNTLLRTPSMEIANNSDASVNNLSSVYPTPTTLHTNTNTNNTSTPSNNNYNVTTTLPSNSEFHDILCLNIDSPPEYELPAPIPTPNGSIYARTTHDIVYLHRNQVEQLTNHAITSHKNKQKKEALQKRLSFHNNTDTTDANKNINVTITLPLVNTKTPKQRSRLPTPVVDTKTSATNSVQKRRLSQPNIGAVKLLQGNVMKLQSDRPSLQSQAEKQLLDAAHVKKVNEHYDMQLVSPSRRKFKWYSKVVGVLLNSKQNTHMREEAKFDEDVEEEGSIPLDTVGHTPEWDKVGVEKITLAYKQELPSTVFSSTRSRGLEAGVIGYGASHLGQCGVAQIEEDPLLWSIRTSIGAPLPILDRITRVACGSYHTVILTDNGQLLASGANHYGQLGLNDRDTRTTFHSLHFRASALNKERGVAVFAGHRWSACITETDNVYVWGSSQYGITGDTGDVSERARLTNLIHTHDKDVQDKETSAVSQDWSMLLPPKKNTSDAVPAMPAFPSRRNSLVAALDPSELNTLLGKVVKASVVTETPQNKSVRDLALLLSPRLMKAQTSKWQALKDSYEHEMTVASGNMDTADVQVPKKAFPSLAHKNVTVISFGTCHAVALTKNGDLYSWGHSEFGALGHPLRDKEKNKRSILPPFVQKPLVQRQLQWRSYWKMVICGHHFTLGIGIDTNQYVWGNAPTLQATETIREVPTVVRRFMRMRIAHAATKKQLIGVVTDEGSVFILHKKEYKHPETRTSVYSNVGEEEQYTCPYGLEKCSVHYKWATPQEPEEDTCSLDKFPSSDDQVMPLDMFGSPEFRLRKPQVWPDTPQSNITSPLPSPAVRMTKTSTHNILTKAREQQRILPIARNRPQSSYADTREGQASFVPVHNSPFVTQVQICDNQLFGIQPNGKVCVFDEQDTVYTAHGINQVSKQEDDYVQAQALVAGQEHYFVLYTRSKEKLGYNNPKQKHGDFH